MHLNFGVRLLALATITTWCKWCSWQIYKPAADLDPSLSSDPLDWSAFPSGLGCCIVDGARGIFVAAKFLTGLVGDCM